MDYIYLIGMFKFKLSNTSSCRVINLCFAETDFEIKCDISVTMEPKCFLSLCIMRLTPAR